MHLSLRRSPPVTNIRTAGLGARKVAAVVHGGAVGLDSADLVRRVGYRGAGAVGYRGAAAVRRGGMIRR